MSIYIQDNNELNNIRKEQDMQLQTQLDNSKRQLIDDSNDNINNNSKLTNSFASRRSRFSNDY